MAQCLIVILHKTSVLPELLETWHSIGVPGVTITNGVGGYRTTKRLNQSRWLRRTIGDLLKLDELQSKVLMAVIDDDDLMERAIAEAERIVGDFSRPDTGVLFTLPVNYVVGLLAPEDLETDITPVRPGLVTGTKLKPRDLPVSVLREILNLEPVVVRTDQSILEIVEAIVEKSGVDVACVVNEQQRLVGLIPLQNLVDDIFVTIVPEEFLGASDKEGVMEYARLTSVRTTRDAMVPAVWVTEDDTVKEAFLKMHKNRLEGIPIVNDRYEVTGYINLQEMLALYIHIQKTSES